MVVAVLGTTISPVLNAGGVTNIHSAAEAAEALRPLAGDLTFVLCALGIVGTGLLAVPVLAGSAAYWVSEAFGWPAILEAKTPDAVGFYSFIAAATVVGFALGYTPIDPIQMPIWSAVLNGIVAVPIMTVMMVVSGGSSRTRSSCHAGSKPRICFSVISSISL
jgi:Mn2+/Fe2+ NRAMP family transporter